MALTDEKFVVVCSLKSLKEMLKSCAENYLSKESTDIVDSVSILAALTSEILYRVYEHFEIMIPSNAALRL